MKENKKKTIREKRGSRKKEGRKNEKEHCLESVRIRSYAGPHFPTYELRYSVSLHIQSECGKIRTRITPNTDTFYSVEMLAALS